MIDSLEPDHLISDWDRRHAERLIDCWLQIARLDVLPSCPELDEPAERAGERAATAQLTVRLKLWTLFREQLRSGKVDERLRQFFAEEAELCIWSTSNPVEAMREFLGLPKRGKRNKRGAPNRTASRNFRLAVEIQKLIDAGEKVEDACGKVYDRLFETEDELDLQYLRKLYFRETRYSIDKDAVRAYLVTEKLPSEP
jgi:hypothetical protein